MRTVLAVAAIAAAAAERFASFLACAAAVAGTVRVVWSWRTNLDMNEMGECWG